MRRVAGSAFVAVAILVASVSGCAAFQKALPYLPTPADAACAATQVERGVTDPLVIVAACPGFAQVAIADIEALIRNLLVAKQAHLAALRASACDAGAEGGK